MRIQTVTLILALFFVAFEGTALAQSDQDESSDAILMIAEEDNCTYAVEPGETLGDAMARGTIEQSAHQEETGNCVRDDRVHKPEGAVGCKCYEHTECNGNESHTCKRHCRRDLCECCKSST